MATSKITNLSILDDTIKNADINSSAAIALTKLSGGINLAASGAGGVTGILPVANGGTATTSYSAGITEADQWRVTASFDGSVQPITSNWEQVDGTAQGNMGSSMAESSGVFTFPSTGFYLVSFGANAEHDADVRYCYAIIDATTNNSSYSDVAYGWGHVKAISGATYLNMYAQTIVDVTDTSNVKVRFGTNTGVGGLTWLGDSSLNNLYATFVRLGDT